jgi:hypothetical protein
MLQYFVKTVCRFIARQAAIPETRCQQAGNIKQDMLHETKLTDFDNLFRTMFLQFFKALPISLMNKRYNEKKRRCICTVLMLITVINTSFSNKLSFSPAYRVLDDTVLYPDEHYFKNM